MDELEEQGRLLREKLAERVRDVFFNTAYPDEILFTKYSDTDVSKDFVNLKWQDVPEELLRRHSWDLSSLHPEVFRYFLPAMLRFILLEPGYMSDLLETITTWLGPYPYSKYHEKWFPRMAEGLTDEQREVIYTLYASHRQLFPDSSLPDDRHGREHFSRALAFWAPASEG